MTSQDLKSRLFIAALAMGVGCGALYLSKTTTWLKKLDASFVMIALSYQNGEQFVHQVDAQSDIITINSVSKAQGQTNQVQSIQITDDPDKIFESSPPSALDYAIILTSLHKRGYKEVILTTSLNWDQQLGLETQGLGRQLAMFSRSAIALPVTRVATPQSLPDILRRSLIPMSRVSGNHRQLPFINYAPISIHADGGKHTLAGFSEVESIQLTTGSIPLLAYWQDEGLIPSIELLTVMMAHTIKPSDIVVDCGHHIRLGKNGPLIPIDEFGHTTAPKNPAKPLAPIQAEKLMLPNNAKGQFHQPKPTALIHAVGVKSASTNTLSPERISRLVALSHHYPITETSATFVRLPLLASMILLLDVALLSFWFGELTRSKRLLAYTLSAALLIPLLFVLLATLLYLSQHWLSLSAPLATLITAWACHVFRR